MDSEERERKDLYIINVEHTHTHTQTDTRSLHSLSPIFLRSISLHLVMLFYLYALILFHLHARRYAQVFSLHSLLSTCSGTHKELPPWLPTLQLPVRVTREACTEMKPLQFSLIPMEHRAGPPPLELLCLEKKPESKAVVDARASIDRERWSVEDRGSDRGGNALPTLPIQDTAVDHDVAIAVRSVTRVRRRERERSSTEGQPTLEGGQRAEERMREEESSSPISPNTSLPSINLSHDGEVQALTPPLLHSTLRAASPPTMLEFVGSSRLGEDHTHAAFGIAKEVMEDQRKGGDSRGYYEQMKADGSRGLALSSHMEGGEEHSSQPVHRPATPSATGAEPPMPSPAAAAEPAPAVACPLAAHALTVVDAAVQCDVLERVGDQPTEELPGIALGQGTVLAQSIMPSLEGGDGDILPPVSADYLGLGHCAAFTAAQAVYVDSVPSTPIRLGPHPFAIDDAFLQGLQGPGKRAFASPQTAARTWMGNADVRAPLSAVLPPDVLATVRFAGGKSEGEHEYEHEPSFLSVVDVRMPVPLACSEVESLLDDDLPISDIDPATDNAVSQG